MDGEKIAACLEDGVGGSSLTDPQVRQSVKVGRMCPRKANAVDAATSERYTVDVDAGVEPVARCRRTEPYGDSMPTVVGQLPAAAAVPVGGRRRTEDFDVRTTMSASVEDAQPQFVPPPADFHLQRPVVHR